MVIKYLKHIFTLTEWLVVGDGAPGPGSTVPLLPPAPGVTTGPGDSAQTRTKTGQLCIFSWTQIMLVQGASQLLDMLSMSKGRVKKNN